MKDKAQIKELTNRIDEILYYLWDPIGVSDEPCARGEYSSYVGILTRLVIEENEHQITEKLTEIESVNMGLTKNPTKNKQIAKRLIEDLYAVQESLR